MEWSSWDGSDDLPGNVGGEMESTEMETQGQTHFNDIPEVIVSNIFSAVKEIRSRNRMALVCRKWREMERATRTYLCVRGNIDNLYMIPQCFQGVTELDLSLCSPWGYPPLDSSSEHSLFIAHILRQAFPQVTAMTIYVRNAHNIELLGLMWPELERVKLVRWHRRATDPTSPTRMGGELMILMHNCRGLRALDLSHFYCWTEDVAPALLEVPDVAANLACLNLMKLSTEGFKCEELKAISSACPNLEELYAVCVFDPRFMDFVGDEALLALAANCPKLRVLHLVDGVAFGDVRGDPEEGFSGEDAGISRQGLEDMFRGLPNLEDLVLDVSRNVRDSGPALEFLGSQCKKLRSLKLGQFHGVCRGPHPDGIATCAGLVRLFIKNCADLDDRGLAAIAVGCRRLGTLELQGCRQITEEGMRFCSSRLRNTLVEARISCCKYLDTAATLRALEPVRESVRKLRIDCIWDESILEKELAAPKSVERSNLTGFGSGDYRREVIRYGTGDCSKKNKSIWKESPKRAWGSSLELGLPDLNYASFDGGSGPSDAPMTNRSLDLDENSYLDPSASCSNSYIFMEQGGLTTSVSSSGVKDSRDMDIDMEEIQLNQNVCSHSDFVQSLGLVDFLGVNEKHQEWQRLEKAGKDDLEVMGERCQMWNVTGGSGKRTPLTNLECEPSYKRKYIYGLSDTTEISEQKCSSYRMDHMRSATWTNLNALSLWIPAGELLTPLAAMGLKSCPVLDEIKIQVEGDCRLCPKPRVPACGLSSLARYPSLSKLELDCGEVIGFALSAPAGQMDLSLWERWYLNGLRDLHLSELNYWPPQDKDMNRRGLSLPAAGLLSECATIRKLFIHGTAHEHFMKMLLPIPNLRDVQLREDFYPAHDDDTSTEMRTESCRRFEEALTKRGFSD